MSFAHHGHTPFLHRFEQRGLRLRRGAVDFVRQHKMREQRSGLENETPASVDLLQHRIARDVAGEQIGRELDPFRVELQRLGEALDQFRLAETRQAFQQQMSASQQPDHHHLDERLLPEKDVVQRVAQPVELQRGGGHFGFGDGREIVSGRHKVI